MGTRSWLMLVAVGVLLLLALDSFYIVNETEKAVLKRFARVEKADIEPGIYPKVPLIDDVVRVDGRLLTHDVPTQSFLTAEKKLLNVDAFVTWRIADVQRYIVSVGAGVTLRSSPPSVGRGAPTQTPRHVCPARWRPQMRHVCIAFPGFRGFRSVVIRRKRLRSMGTVRM